VEEQRRQGDAEHVSGRHGTKLIWHWRETLEASARFPAHECVGPIKASRLCRHPPDKLKLLSSIPCCSYLRIDGEFLHPLIHDELLHPLLDGKVHFSLLGSSFSVLFLISCAVVSVVICVGQF
jgi:hypothetical protein